MRGGGGWKSEKEESCLRGKDTSWVSRASRLRSSRQWKKREWKKYDTLKTIGNIFFTKNAETRQKNRNEGVVGSVRIEQNDRSKAK